MMQREVINMESGYRLEIATIPSFLLNINDFFKNSYEIKVFRPNGTQLSISPGYSTREEAIIAAEKAIFNDKIVKTFSSTPCSG